MAMTKQELLHSARTGGLTLQALSADLASNSNPVTIQDAGACYSSGTGQLSAYCTLIANSPTEPITGAGLLAYSGDGSTLYAAQYTNGFESTNLPTSVGTTLYNPQSGNQVLLVAYGWTNSASFYMTQKVTIGNCVTG